ncbi:putative probable thiamine biosynthetic bifunctional enzyme [[Candida] jaroonii]|uniref:Probable thiamine biosynthetic bifunctional enzyme n=1 Tax=[Candida] jaroonii TaxID=467808 RepID=A0ACA9YDX9_9ASCO|nr:putative probable thiamine biosynthetic bifunctional enzyme [[Candida] jaroonii]
MCDYSVYLVTDSTMVPSTSTFIKQVEGAINGGATVVQLREKNLSTQDFIRRAQQVHELTKAKGIPLIINDRIDVALAVDAEGVHIGQDDMPIDLARKLIGDKILGVSCSTVEEAAVACGHDIDYIGIGAVYSTATKKDTKNIIGPVGVRKVLKVLRDGNTARDGTMSGARPKRSPIKCVAIGGINETNGARVLHQCQIQHQKLDGLAVVSCIMAREDAYRATKDLVDVINKGWWHKESAGEWTTSLVPKQMAQVRTVQPLVHHITNNVVKNFSANVTLAVGASPIMSELPEEFPELAALGNTALVLNLGTPSAAMMEVFHAGLSAYNHHGKHIVFDPVACGATTARLNCCRQLLNHGQMSVIKGNLGEIMGIYKLCSGYAAQDDGAVMRGVDSVATMDEESIVRMATEVSKDFRTVVVVTGATNYIVCNDKVETVEGGSQLMGRVTGSGCSLGSVIGAFLGGASEHSVFGAVAAAVTVYNQCGRKAAAVQHPGSFISSFIDELSRA